MPNYRASSKLNFDARRVRALSKASRRLTEMLSMCPSPRHERVRSRECSTAQSFSARRRWMRMV